MAFRAVRNVRDIPAHERESLEHVIGQRLRQNQQVIINVVNVDLTAPTDDIEMYGPLLDRMYRKEYVRFRDHLYWPGEYEEMWTHLDRMFGRPASSG
jgi:hypothetical protein